MSATSLLPAVRAAFAAARSLGYNNATAAHDVYEGYVLALLMRAAMNRGWTPHLRDVAGKTPSHVVFRLGPGRLPSGNYTHLLLTRPNEVDLEAHIGVKVSGKAPYRVTPSRVSATVLHEFDLLVLPASAADRCRRHGTDPTYANVFAHAEAKFHGGNLPLPLGRAVVGLAEECNLAGRSVLVTNRNGLSVQDLIQHYGVAFRFLVTPGSQGETSLVSFFESLF
jgi:hypothetical protein